MIDSLHPHSEKKKRGKLSAKKLFSFLLILALLGATAGTGFLYWQTKQELQRLTTPEGQQELAQREIEITVEALGKLTLLPEEEPVVATIMDAALMASQSAFYQNTQNGDKLVVYPQAQRAFIYSPSRRILVNSGPLIVDESGGTQQQGEGPTVEVRNGSNTVGAGTRLAEDLTRSGFRVSAVADAANKNYQQTVVVNNGGDDTAQAATQVAQALGGSVSALPAGEANSEAQLLIIVGNAGQPTPAPTPAAEASPAPQQ